MTAHFTRFLFLAALCATGLMAAGCGSDGSDGDATTPRTGVRVALVTDIGGLNDRGFNALANRGLKRAERELGIEGRVFISNAANDYIPNLTTAVRDGYDLVIGVGFLMGDALADVAERFPETNFAIVDFPSAALDGKPANVRGLVFSEQEAGYLAGVAAATVADDGAVSAVGGQAVPAVVAFLAGYRAGAKATRPGIRVIEAYSQDFVAQDKCRELALNQIQAGSRVVFAAAGGCGLGALGAADDRNLWGIGVDSDQSFLGPHILTSATKKVDVAVFRTIDSVREETFEGGGDTVFNVANGGVGYGKVSPRAPDRTALLRELDDVAEQIASGEIDVPRE